MFFLYPQNILSRRNLKMLLNELACKKIAIWGFGKEGQALLHFFTKNMPDKQIGVLSPENEKNIFNYEVVFKSPGISIYHPLVELAKKNGVLISSGTNLYMENKPKKIQTIAITGTKGKSTTASLIAHCLKKMGLKIALAGNIGTPLIDFYGTDLDFLIAELSSYQCTDLSTGFDRTIVTNLYPEHINWHKTHFQYYKDKLHILSVRTKGQKAILNIQNNQLISMTQNLPDVLYFNQQRISIQSQLLGAHNLENIDAVRITLESLNFSTKNIEIYLKDFKPLPHRLEIIEHNGITYVDDSISTTPETAMAGLQVFEGRKCFLLVGGFDRQQNYNKLEEYAKQHSVSLIGLPDTGRRIHTAVYQAQNILDATRYAQSKAKNKDVIILSPAAPSYNTYKNFEERGEDFKKTIF